MQKLQIEQLHQIQGFYKQESLSATIEKETFTFWRPHIIGTKSRKPFNLSQLKLNR